MKNEKVETACMLPNQARYQLRYIPKYFILYFVPPYRSLRALPATSRFQTSELARLRAYQLRSVPKYVIHYG